MVRSGKAGPNSLLSRPYGTELRLLLLLLSIGVPAFSLHCIVYESRGPGLPEQLDPTATTHCCQHLLVCRVWRTLSGPHPSPSCLTPPVSQHCPGSQQFGTAASIGDPAELSTREMEDRSAARYCSTPLLSPGRGCELPGWSCCLPSGRLGGPTSGRPGDYMQAGNGTNLSCILCPAPTQLSLAAFVWISRRQDRTSSPVHRLCSITPASRHQSFSPHCCSIHMALHWPNYVMIL